MPSLAFRCLATTPPSERQQRGNFSEAVLWDRRFGAAGDGRVGEGPCRSTIASPLFEPDVRISLIRLSRKLSPLSSTPTEVGLAERHSLDLRWELFPNLAAGDP